MSLASVLSSRPRGRLVFALAVGLFVAVTGWLVFGHRFYLLEHIGIGTMQPRFVDAHVITGARESLARGCDPLVENPGDPLGRAMNYPRVWLALAHAGVGIEATGWLVAAFLVCFGLGLGSLVPLATGTGGALLLAAGLFAPATWLAVERGNCDLAMFGLVAGAAWLVARAPRAAVGGLAAAAALKLYPVFAVVGLVADGSRPWRRRVGWFVLAFALYLFVGRDDLARIRAHTWHWANVGYGIDQLPEWLAARGVASATVALAGGVGVLLGAAAAGSALRARRVLGGGGAHCLTAFRMGAAVYVGSFCLGSNFDYRLVFLLLVLPQLAAWATASHRAVRAGASLLAVLVLVLQWSISWRAAWAAFGGGEAAGAWLDEVASWVLAVGLLPALALSAPAGIVPAAWRQVPRLDAADGAVRPGPAAATQPRRDGRDVGAVG